jgi:hypothetical protein
MPLYIEEFTGMTVVSQQQLIQAARQPSLTSQAVEIGEASGQSAIFNVQTKYVRLHASEDCHYAFGKTPEATTASPRMAAGQTEYFVVDARMRVAVIAGE